MLPPYSETIKDPRFWKLSYSGQVEYRQHYFQEELAKTDTFQKFSPEDKQKFYEVFLFDRPYMANPYGGVMTVEQGESVRRAAEGGNQRAAEIYQNMTKQSRDLDEMAKKIANEDPFTINTLKEITAANRWNNRQALFKLGAKILEKTGMFDMYSELYGEDKNKLADWAEALKQNNATVAKRMETSVKLPILNVGLFDLVGEIVNMWTLTAMFGTGPTGTVGKAFMHPGWVIGAKTASQVGTAVGRIVQLAGLGVAGGLTDVMSESLLMGLESRETENKLQRVGMAFGMGAAFDFGFSMLGGLFKFMKTTGKVMFKAKRFGAKGLDPGWRGIDFKRDVRDVFLHEARPRPGVFYEPYQKAIYGVQARVLDLANHPERIIPGSFEELQTASFFGNNPRKALVQLEDGRIIAYDATNWKAQTQTFDSITSARRTMAEEMLTLDYNLGDGIRAVRTKAQEAYLETISPNTTRVKSPSVAARVVMPEKTRLSKSPAHDIVRGLNAENSPFYIPESTYGGMRPSNRIIARSLMEETATGRILKNLDKDKVYTLKNFEKAVDYLSTKDAFDFKPLKTTPTIGAWWKWADQGTYIKLFREFAELPEMFERTLGKGPFVNPERVKTADIQGRIYRYGFAHLNEESSLRAAKGLDPKPPGETYVVSVGDIDFEGSDFPAVIFAPEGHVVSAKVAEKAMKEIDAFYPQLPDDLRAEYYKANLIQRGFYAVQGPGGELNSLIPGQVKLITRNADPQTGAIKSAIDVEPNFKSKMTLKSTKKYTYPDGAAESLISKIFPGSRIVHDPQTGKHMIAAGRELGFKKISHLQFDSKSDLAEWIVSRGAGNLDQLNSSLIDQDIPITVKRKKVASEGANFLVEIPDYPRSKTVGVDNFSDAVDIIQKAYPDFEVWMPTKYGPDVIFPDSDVAGAKVTTLADGRTQVTGPYRDIMAYMRKFKDPEPTTTVKLASSKGATMKFDRIQERYRVRVKDLDHWQEFDSYKSAKAFFDSDHSAVTELQEIGASKRMDVYYREGEWRATDPNGNTFAAKDIPGLKRIIGTIHTPETLPEIIGGVTLELQNEIDRIRRANPDIVGEGTNIVNQSLNRSPRTVGKYAADRANQLFDAALYPTSPAGGGIEVSKLGRELSTKKNFPISMTWQLTNKLATVESNIRRIARGYQLPELTVHFRRLVEGIRQYHSEHYKTMQLITGVLQDPATKKVYSVKKLKGIGRYMDAEQAGKTSLNPAEFDLVPADLPTIDAIHAVLGESPNEGLGLLFGVGWDNWTKNYVARVRDFAHKGKKGVTLNEVYENRSMPDGINEFFKHDRTLADAANMALEENILESLSYYSRTGHRARALNGPFGEFRKYFNETVVPALGDDKVSMRVLQDFGVMLMSNKHPAFMDNVMGFQKAIIERLPKFLKNSLMKKGSLDTDWMDKAMRNTYAGLMGFRVWLSVRNSLQIWSHLATKFGIGHTWKAYKDVVSGDINAQAAEYFSRGILREHLSLAGAETLPRGGKVFKLAMQGFQNADILDRLVGVRLGENLFNETMEKWGKTGVIKNWKQFANSMQLDMMPLDVQDIVLKLLKRNQVDMARDTFANAIQRGSFFDYSKEMVPQVTKQSVLGRLFGVMGTFSAFTRDLVGSTMRVAPAGKKVAFAARWIGVNTALWGALQMFGIEGGGIGAYQPLMFNGGPWWKFGNTVLNAFGTDYRARQARGELANPRWMQQFVPYGITIGHAIKALSLIGQGDYYGALLTAMTAPYNPKGK